MTDEANMLYGGIPERLYIIEDEHIAYVGNIGPWDYNVAEIEAWLQEYKERVQRKED